jgi:hypothetical protein
MSGSILARSGFEAALSSIARVTFVDARTAELRAAHDVLSEFWAKFRFLREIAEAIRT